MKTLVIGGTGPTGPFIVRGLVERGHEVAMLNRGSRPAEDVPASVERIQGDPHFQETLREALGRRRFDVVVATYGRLRHVADVMADHTDRLVSIGGSPQYRGVWQPGLLFPHGLQVPLPEDAPKVESSDEQRFGWLARQAEEAVMANHAAGRYVATHLRYPLIYGPRQLLPVEWWVMRRILDGRRRIVLPEGGITLHMRGYSENMAHAVLLAVDRPEASAGRTYNCGDVHQFTQAQWVQVIADEMGVEMQVIGVPAEFAWPARDLMLRRAHGHHHLFDLHAIRRDLGYADVVPPVEAVRRTVRWYLENRPQESEEQTADYAVHYRSEDAIAALHAEFSARLAAVEHVDRTFVHPYPHPTAPGQGRDQRGR